MSTLEGMPTRSGVGARLHDFFYANEVPYGLALVRIAICLFLLMAMVPRWSHARELFSRDGSPVPLWTVYGHAPLFPEPSGEVAVAIHSILILTLITSCVGLCTRPSLILATSGYILLNMLDLLGTMNKYSVIAAHLMFLLCFSQCGTIWSIDNWLKRSRLRRAGVPAEVADRPERSSAAVRRVMQLFIGIVYLGAALTKLRVPAYFSGEQLQTWMITNYNAPNWLGHYFAFHLAILSLFGTVALVWECLFLFLSWRGLSRLIMLAIGTTFHLMTLLTLGLYLFPAICVTCYLSFINERDIEALSGLFARWRESNRALPALIGGFFRPRINWLPPAINPRLVQASLAVLVLITAGVGVAAEYKLDPYGMRRPEGPYSLKALDPNTVTELLRSSERIRNEDKIMLFDIGSKVVSGAVIDRRTEFRQGESMKAECDLLPPHEDLWLTCDLYNSENRVIDTTGCSVSCDSMRSIFDYHIGETMPPGDYWLSLKMGSTEIIRRGFRVIPGPKSAPLAN